MAPLVKFPERTNPYSNANNDKLNYQCEVTVPIGKIRKSNRFDTRLHSIRAL